MSYLTDIGDFISSLGYTPISYFSANKTTPNCIIIAPYGGSNKSPATPELLTQPDVQIMVRTSDKETGFNTASSIFEILRKDFNQTHGSTKFKQIYPKMPPVYAGTNEDSGLHHFSINCSVLY